MHSVIDNIKSVLAIASAALTSTTTSAAIDTLGYNSGKLVLNLGVIDITTGNETYVLTITECATSNGSFVDTGIVLPTVVGGVNDGSVVVQRLDGLGSARKRFLKVVATLGGTTPILNASATLELGHAFSNPV